MGVKTFLDTGKNEERGTLTISAKDVVDMLNVNTLLSHENKMLRKRLNKLEKEVKDIKQSEDRSK